MQFIKENTATREAMEVYNAGINLKASGDQLNKNLEKNSSNYNLAVTNYRVQAKLAHFVIGMNAQFENRIDDVYRPRFRKLLQRIDEGSNQLYLAKNIDLKVKKSEQEKLNALKTAISNALSKLSILKNWTEKNIDRLKKRIATLNVVEKNAAIARDASILVSKINLQVGRIEFTEPAIIEYELKNSDFEIQEPASAQ